MSDSRKSCLGFIFLIAALLLAILALVAGGVGALIERLGGQSYGLDLGTGTLIGIGLFVFFGLLALYMFARVKDYSWLPAILAGAYTFLPDLIVGPEDDILALVVGAALSGFLAWRKSKRNPVT